MKLTVEWIAPLPPADPAGSPAEGISGRWAGEAPPRALGPMESVLMALCACTGLDVVEILRKMRAPLDELRVEADAERQADPPRVFTEIHLRVLARGHGLRRGQVERAVALSVDKYCPVAVMLRQAVPITYEVIVESG